MNIRYISLVSSFIFILLSCQNAPQPLPYLRVKENPEDKPAIPEYHFIDQLNRPVTPQTFKDKVYLTDFFFTSCPTICPIVTGQMLRIYEHFNNDNRVAFLSHSIDTRHDSVPRLKAYADKLHINDDKWRFVTGKKDDIFSISKSYLSIVLEDPNTPGGFNHSGYIILVDKDRHIRAFCNGTDPKDVDKFIPKIQQLLDSE